MPGPNFPAREQPIDSTTGLFTLRILNWFRDLSQQVQSNPAQVIAINLTGQHATINTTAIATAALASGLYRVTYYMHVTTADGAASAAQSTIFWTDDTFTCSRAGTNMNGDTTATTTTDTMLVHIDAASPISYAVAYSSTTPNKMHFSFSLILESF